MKYFHGDLYKAKEVFDNMLFFFKTYPYQTSWKVLFRLPTYICYPFFKRYDYNVHRARFMLQQSYRRKHICW